MERETRELLWDGARFLGASLVVVLVIAGCLVGIMGPISFYSDRYECQQTSENAGVKTRFVKNHILSWDCYVEVDQGWIPISKWRGDEE